MAKLRLTTEGRAVLCGLSQQEKSWIHGYRWRVYGDVGAGSQLMLSMNEKGLKVTEDGRIYIPDGQDLLNVHEELELGEPTIAEDGKGAIFPVVGRAQPDEKKAAHMAARPVKPPPPPYSKHDMTLGLL